MASESQKRWLFTFAGNVTPKKDESLADSLLKSYIDTQFLFIESSLNNLKKQFSTSAWNDDEAKELVMLNDMFASVKALIKKDNALESKNAARVGRMESLIREVIKAMLDYGRLVQHERENAPDVRPQAENTRQNLRVADRNQISPKAEEPPQRDPFPSRLLDSQDNRYRKPLDPDRVDHSEKEKAVVAELMAKFTKQNAAAVALASGVGSPMKACFQTLNPYVV